MSFLEDISTFGKGVVDYFKGNTIASTIVKVASIGLLVNKLSSNATASNNTNGTNNIDAGVRLQVTANTDNKVPVLYGSAYFGGIITDAVMTNTNKTMYYCLTLCEQTGTKLSDGQASEIKFKDIYWNNQRIVFNNDGITANYTVDANGQQDTSISGLVTIRGYSGGSASPKQIETGATYSGYQSTPAYSFMPGWSTSTHTMNDLVFAIVKVDYNKDKNVTGLGDMLFRMENTMTLPGDCIYDYMNNSRYGAAIDATEINAQ